MSPFASRCVLSATLLLAGCALDRTPLLPDGGSRHDGGPACPDTGCDDGNRCTDDACIAGTGCVFTPNTASCDDGMLCNGADTCSDGACVHDMVDPCPGASTCNPTTNACEGCESSSDCPAEMRVPSGTCNATDICATSGTEDVTITSYTCQESQCVASTRTETQACTRATDGVSCGIPRTEPGDCSYAGPCADSGSRTVSTFTPVCMSGVCQEVESMTTDTAGCTRTTEGTTCADPTMVMGTCTYADTCAESGSRTDTVTTHTCVSGACTATTTPTSVPCTRSTTGTVCGACTPYGECTYTTPEMCGGDAARSRGCPTCARGACPGTPNSIDTMACTPASVNGTRCVGDDTACGACECPRGRFVCTVHFERCNAGSVCTGDAGMTMVEFPCPCP